MADVIDIVELRRLPQEMREFRGVVRGLMDRFTLLEQRVGGMEYRFAAMEIAQEGLRETLGRIERQIDIGFGDANGRIDRVEARLDQMEQRLGKVEQRLDRMEQRQERMEQRLDRVEASLAEMKGMLQELLARKA